MLPTATELQYFFEVAYSLNLSRASERLGISQPSLSLAIKKLETNIGVKLFVRHQQGMALTQSGKQLLKHAQQLMHCWSSAKASALASQHETCGSFTLGCHSTIATEIVTKFLPSLLNQHPHLEIHLKHDVSRKILEAVNNFQIDIGIVMNPINHPELVSFKLATDEMGFWIFDSKRNAATADKSTLLCDPDLYQTKELMKKCNKRKILFNRIITMNSLEVVASLISKDCGIGILPKSIATSMNQKLKQVINMPTYKEELYLIYRHESYETQAFRTIIKSIKELNKLNQVITKPSSPTPS